MKRKHIQRLLTPIHVACALVPLKTMLVMEMVDGYHAIVEDGCMRTV